MNYLIYSNDGKLVNNRLKKLTNNQETTFFLESEEDCNNVVQTITTYDFFKPTKIILVKNIQILFKKANTKLSSALEEFLQALKLADEKDTICLVAYVDTLALSSGFGLALSKLCKVEKIESITKYNKKKYILDQLTALKIKPSMTIVDYLETHLLEDAGIIELETSKLAMLETLDLNNVKNVITPSLNENVFEMVDALLTKNMASTFKIYYNLKTLVKDPISYLALIASKLIMYYQVLTLAKQNYNAEQIATKINAKNYPVTLILQQRQKVNSNELLHFLDFICDLDSNIKNGSAQRYVDFEVGMLNYLIN